MCNKGQKLDSELFFCFGLKLKKKTCICSTESLVLIIDYRSTYRAEYCDNNMSCIDSSGSHHHHNKMSATKRRQCH